MYQELGRKADGFAPPPQKKRDAVLKCWQNLGPYPAFDKDASINETILYNSLYSLNQLKNFHP